MLSDKFRAIKMISLGGIIFCLGWYAAVAAPKIDIPPAQKLTGQFDYPVYLEAQYTEIVTIYQDAATLILKIQGREFTARFSELPPAQAGQTLSVAGLVTALDFMEVSTWHLHPARSLKYYFSLPAIALVIYLLFKKYRFDWRKMEFFEK